MRNTQTLENDYIKCENVRDAGNKNKTNGCIIHK